MRKTAFTFIELIFVIIIVGILSSVAISRMGGRNDLKAATEQVIRHINYTKHLAMTDDKFTPEPKSNTIYNLKDSRMWYKKNWQLYFSTSGGSLHYAIFSDTPTSTDTNPDYFNADPSAGEVADDPHSGEKMTGESNDDFNIENKYNIVNVALTGGCNQKNTILFDNFGRPYNGFNKDVTTNNPYADLYKIATGCLITMTHQNEGNSYICIEPVTGYVREVASPGDCN